MNRIQNYVIWLDGFLDACQGTPTPDQTKKIKEKLNNIFEHVADKPQIPLGELHGLYPHGGAGKPSVDAQGNTLYRC